ncbi:MAG: hypothetical protein M1821_003785 [Bathelium mastoideum]|nr:MAG: hypothetical protein M1821_003785 [Bathelium mastoideum]
MTGREKRIISSRESPTRYRRPVKVGTRHVRNSSASSGSGVITGSPNAATSSTKTAPGRQDKSLPPTPKSEAETVGDHMSDARATYGNEDRSLHRAHSWETTSHDNESKERGRNDEETESQLAEVERALETSREEQQKMLKELQKLKVERDGHKQERRQLQEDMARLRLDHEQDLHSQQTKLDEKAKLAEYWSEKHQAALTDLDSLKERWLERDEMWKHEWERKAAEVLEERDELREKLHTMQKVAQVRGEEGEEARRQLLDLKQSISTSTRVQNQVTDHEFGDIMSGLNNEIQNWIVHSFRKSKNNLSNLSSVLRDSIKQVLPLYERVMSSSRLVFYQAFMVDRLMEIFNAPFFGLPEHGPLNHADALIDYLEDPSSEYTQWRSLTLSIIDQDRRGDLAAHTEKSLRSIQMDIISTLNELTGTEMTTSQEMALEAITENVVKAARLVHRQRARFVFELPKVSVEKEARFDGKVMEDVNGEDEEDLRGRKIQCATFPAVYKMGDERGENMHLRNVIFKARVLCAPPPE